MLFVSRTYSLEFSEQLKMLKKINFGHVICATTNLSTLPLEIFKSVHEYV